MILGCKTAAVRLDPDDDWTSEEQRPIAGIQLKEKAAGGFDSLAVDPAAIVGQQRGDGAADVVGKSYAAQGSL